MSSEVKFNWQPERFIQAARVSAENALFKGCQEVQNQMSINLSGKSPSAPGSFPGADTGRLSREIFNKSIGPMTRAVGSELKYGRYLEYGAVITPKNVKYLPVPMNKAARRMLSRLGGASLRTKKLVLIARGDGSSKPGVRNAGRGKGRKVFAGRRTPKTQKRGYKLFLVEPTAGGKPSKSATAAAFVLKKRVVLAARPWCYRTAVQTRDQFYKRFEFEMKKGLRAAAGGAA